MKLTVSFFILAALGIEMTWALSPCQMESRVFVENDFQVEVLELRTKKSSGKSLLIVPPTGGTNYLDRSYAKFFCDSGYDVFVLNRWTGDDEISFDLQIHQRFYDRANKAISLAISQLPRGFVGVLGTSVGALHVVHAIQVDPRIQAAFLIVGGGPVPDVIAHSDQEILVQAKQKRFELFGFENEEQYAEALRENIRFKSERGNLNPDLKIGMVIADADTTVPTRYQKELQRLLAPEMVLPIKGSHISVILKTWMFHKKALLRFFEDSAKVQE